MSTNISKQKREDLLNKIKEKQISDRDTLKNTIKFAQTSCC